MSPTDALLPGVLAPAVLCGLVLAFGWRPWRTTETIDGVERPDGRALGGLAVGAAFFLANGLMFGWPTLGGNLAQMPVLERVAWAALALGVLLWLEGPLGVAAPLLRIACAAGLLWWILAAFGRSDDLRQLGSLLAAMAILGAGLQLLARRVRGPSLPLVLMATGTASALTIGLAVSAKMGQLEGALCAALGAAWVLSLWRRRVTIAGPALTAWVLLHGALLVCAWVYGLAVLDVALLAAAPLAAWLAELPALRPRRSWHLAALRLAYVLIPAAVPVVRALLTFEADPYDYQ